jgi:hypothetical protein
MKAHFEFYTPEHEYLGVIKCKGKSAQFAQLVASGYTYHQNEMKYWPLVNHWTCTRIETN